ncbi:MAG: MoxR family ATPase [Oscillospiraceae bacterium]|nr:MoxR family ATPase [Oscillospiraceae bacterium]
MTAEAEKIIIGKREKIELIIMALLADGHILIEDMPGVGKTTLVKVLAQASGCSSKRVQFVPDLLPSDITGLNIYDQKSGEFRLLRGPVFTNLLLADEINRAVPRTQSALLEAMEEKRVTIDGESMKLNKPFMVMATQNPVESESTFRLPAAQMDRFLIRISMGYPDAEEEKRMLYTLGDEMPFDKVNTVSDPETIIELRGKVMEVKLSEAVADYIVAITTATRSFPGVAMGASPRASRALYRASKAWAAMQGRDFVTPDDVKYLAPFVLSHRLLMSGEARLSGLSGESVIKAVLEKVSVPPETKSIFDGK